MARVYEVWEHIPGRHMWRVWDDETGETVAKWDDGMMVVDAPTGTYQADGSPITEETLMVGAETDAAGAWVPGTGTRANMGGFRTEAEAHQHAMGFGAKCYTQFAGGHHDQAVASLLASQR